MSKPDDHDEKSGKSAAPTKIVTGLNATIAMVALLVVGFGVFLKAGFGLVEDTIRPGVRHLLDLGANAGLDGIDVDKLNIGELLDSISLPLSTIIVGVYTLVLSATGLFSAKLKLPPLLIAYCVMLGLGILAQVVCLALLMTQRQLFDDIVRPNLENSIREYRGYNETNIASQSWTIVMVVLQCCGASSYRDFRLATDWRRKLFQDGWWFELRTPLPCCRMEGKSPDDFSCAVNPTPLTSNYSRGCYNEVWMLIDQYKVIPLVIVGFLVCGQIILFVATAILIRQLVQARLAKGDDSEIDHEEEQGENAGKLVSLAQRCAARNGLPNGQETGCANERALPYGVCQGGRDISEGLMNGFRTGMTGGFDQLNGSDIIRDYVRRNTASDLLSQFLLAGRSNGNFGKYNNGNFSVSNIASMPNMYGQSSGGPVIVQLPPSPEISMQPKLTDRTVRAVEAPPTIAENYEFSEPLERVSRANEQMESVNRRRQFSRCNSDGNMLGRSSNSSDLVGFGPTAKLPRRTTLR